MRYNISLSLIVDNDAAFLEADRRSNLSVIEELVSSAIYEIDDVRITYIEVEDDS